MPGMKKIARRAGLQTEDVQAVFDALTVLLSQGESVRVPNFGTFGSRVQAARTINSPVLPGGEATTLRRRVIKFRMSATLREDWRME